MKLSKIEKERRVKLKTLRLGVKHTKDTKNKIRKAHLGKKQSSELIEKRISKIRGRKQSKSERLKHSIALKGKKKSLEHRKKMRGNRPNISGNKHPNWQGGKSFEPYSVDWTETLKRSIRERDNYICQLCSKYGNSVHHIDYNKKNCNPNNLITLCKKCHTKTNYSRRKWIVYFNKINR